ncbi:HEPN domain-containing protein [Candidatus Woesearchaeota archaeon]|nr:HEPN domain-containing protein [Candidatus Woesearchaeota archaeon]
MEKHHFEQAKIWLSGASLVANLNSGGDDKYAVAVSMAVHAIIKANDALTYKFLNATAKRHDDAPRLFEDLIKKNCVNVEYANYRSILHEAIGNKAKAEYRGAYFSKNDFESMKRNAEKFIKMAGTIIV